jgi:peptidoglycan-associated lipoprotein
MGNAGVAGQSGAAGTKWTTFKDILFDFDKSNVRANEVSEIDKIAAYVQQNPSVSVGIDGHADPRGTDGYNQSLSERRVSAIKDALMKAGVPTEKIQTGAFGESRLKCNEQTEACWQRDRRVEVLMGTNTASK